MSISVPSHSARSECRKLNYPRILKNGGASSNCLALGRFSGKRGAEVPDNKGKKKAKHAESSDDEGEDQISLSEALATMVGEGDEGDEGDMRLRMLLAGAYEGDEDEDDDYEPGADDDESVDDGEVEGAEGDDE